MVLSSNEKLDRLDLIVAPSQVRLQPSSGDGYAWSITESKKSLLQSNLGSGSAGRLRRLLRRRYRLPKQNGTTYLEKSAEDRGKTRPVYSEKESGSFTAKIRVLECANHDISGELNRIRIYLEESLGENREI
ncbi:hypothetical protein N7527_004815 [Penicillium freii]|nr:hypothetical protein N7527_004815 [Penicillium freii]